MGCGRWLTTNGARMEASASDEEGCHHECHVEYRTAVIAYCRNPYSDHSATAELYRRALSDHHRTGRNIRRGKLEDITNGRVLREAVACLSSSPYSMIRFDWPTLGGKAPTALA